MQSPSFLHRTFVFARWESLLPQQMFVGTLGCFVVNSGGSNAILSNNRLDLAQTWRRVGTNLRINGHDCQSVLQRLRDDQPIEWNLGAGAAE